MAQDIKLGWRRAGHDRLESPGQLNVSKNREAALILKLVKAFDCPRLTSAILCATIGDRQAIEEALKCVRGRSVAQQMPFWRGELDSRDDKKPLSNPKLKSVPNITNLVMVCKGDDVQVFGNCGIDDI